MKQAPPYALAVLIYEEIVAFYLYFIVEALLKNGNILAFASIFYSKYLAMLFGS